MPERADPLKLPVAIGPAASRARTTAEADPAFAAQALGQEGQKRGLKGGRPVLEAAQDAYVRVQWSGSGDRRSPTGRVRRDEV